VAGLGSLTERSHFGHQTRGGLGKPINHQLSTINCLHHLAAQFGSRSSHPYGKDSISSLLLLKMVTIWFYDLVNLMAEHDIT